MGFGGIEPGIGRRDQGVRVPLSAGSHDKAKASANAEAQVTHRDGFNKHGKQAVSEGASAICISSVNQHGKFVATEAADQGIIADAVPEAHSDGAQQVITDSMAMPVIDRLESVQVEEEQRWSAATIERELEPVKQAAAIGEAGKWVGCGQLAHLLLQQQKRDQLIMALCHQAGEKHG